MATVRMKKGDKYADVYDSPETIKQAQLDGYSVVENKKAEPAKEVKEEPKEETPKASETEKTTARTRRQ